MKKIGFASLILAGMLVMLVILCIIGFSSGGAGSISSPLIAFATEEEAYAYQYIGSELGVPWDIVLLTDGMAAYEAGKSDLSTYNPMLTSLQFCILVEEKLVLKKKDVSGNTVSNGDVSGNETQVTAEDNKWEVRSTAYYTGQKEILDYIGVNAQNLTYKDAAGLIAAMNKLAEEKSTGNEKYVVTLTVNPDYEKVLTDFIGLSEENVRYVLEIHNTNYLILLYGYSVVEEDIELPEITVGAVTRQDLAEVAVSLLGHPYQMGGKYSQIGVPTGPLDCSGYVDWVYVQCFGKVVSSGRIPDGVAVSGTALQWYATEKISASELKVGDLGFLYDPASMGSGQINHVGIYIGTCNGKLYFIHCAGRAYGTPDSPSGRVGISCLDAENNYNLVTDSTFSPSMKKCRFRFFRRPQFAFIE